MKINCFSAIFWFNIVNNHTNLLDVFQKEFQDEYNKFDVFNYTNNLVAPILAAVNDEKMTNLTFSQINLQYNMDKVTSDNLDEFKIKVLKIFEILRSNNIEISYAAIFLKGEIQDDQALATITKNTISSLPSEDLMDFTLKLGKKHEDLFYKIISLTNKRKIKLPKKVDAEGRLIPLPLISSNGVLVENEIIDITYEINDKYLFDFTKNYHTTEFYLNKMLYLFAENFESDILDLIETGKF